MDLTTDANGRLVPVLQRFLMQRIVSCSYGSACVRHNAMDKILERYKRYSYAERTLFSNETDPQE
ncbi:hypothetical protein HPP92_012256 [Vanilla planifolia]|uniref:Uncharacterized protein n=1 Tax=Vanilla planifolia TaxID=51239 RepID=A0A835R7Q1_VANPL|nr:hypothetical protein HPP92_012256 [Vanilla planifolia]